MNGFTVTNSVFLAAYYGGICHKNICERKNMGYNDCNDLTGAKTRGKI
jgi:hypothetical protein